MTLEDISVIYDMHHYWELYFVSTKGNYVLVKKSFLYFCCTKFLHQISCLENNILKVLYIKMCRRFHYTLYYANILLPILYW